MRAVAVAVINTAGRDASAGRAQPAWATARPVADRHIVTTRDATSSRKRRAVSWLRVPPSLAPVTPGVPAIALVAWALAIAAIGHGMDGVIRPGILEPLLVLIALPLAIEMPRRFAIASGSARLLRALDLDPDALDTQVLHWLAGVMLLVTAGAAVAPLPGFSVTAYLVVAFAVVLFSPLSRESTLRIPRRIDLSTGLAIAIVLLGVLSALLIIRVHQPYPMLDGAGIASYGYRMDQFLQDGILRLAPGLHTPVHSAVLAPIAHLSGAEALGPMWAAPVALYLVYAFGAWHLASMILEDRRHAALAAGVALFLLAVPVFRHMHAAGMRAFVFALQPLAIALVLRVYETTRPASRDLIGALAFAAGLAALTTGVRYAAPHQLQPWLIAAIVGVGIAALLRARPRPIALFAALALLASGLTFLHAFDGPAAMAVAGALLLCRHAVGLRPRGGVVVPALVFAASALFIVQATGLITFSDPSMFSRDLLGERADAIILDYESKVTELRLGLTVPVLLILAVAAERRLFGAWTQIASTEGPKAEPIEGAVAAVAAVFFVYLLPESNSFRFVSMVVPLMAILVVAELGFWARLTAQWLRIRKEKLVVFGAVAAVLVGIGPALSQPLRRQAPPSPLTLSAYDREDLAVAGFLRSSTGRNTLIVSDPMTMFLLEGLAYRPQIAEKRAWVAISEYSTADRARLTGVRNAVFDAALTPAQSLANACTLAGRPFDAVALVLTERTAAWALNPSAPLFLTDARARVEFLAPRFAVGGTFSPAYSRDGAVVLIAHQPCGVSG